MVEGREIIQNYFQIIFELRQLTSSQPARVFSSFRCLFLLHLGLSKTFTFPRTLRRAEYQNLAALSIFTVKLFFSGPRIRIIAEDNAHAEDAVTYRCNAQVLEQYCLFRAETQWFLLSNDSLANEKIRATALADKFGFVFEQS